MQQGLRMKKSKNLKTYSTKKYHRVWNLDGVLEITGNTLLSLDICHRLIGVIFSLIK